MSKFLGKFPKNNDSDEYVFGKNYIRKKKRKESKKPRNYNFEDNYGYEDMNYKHKKN